MDKSTICFRKAEEKDLSENLHKKLEALMLVYPASSEFKSLFVKDMFLKSNPKAFPYLMHFLFTILDPVEFQKRFYWPIDKSSETAFRTTTVQYLNYINKKYNLEWIEIKAFLVVMPGGIKFISFIIDFIDFIVSNEIRKVEERLGENVPLNKTCLTQEELKKITRNNEILIKNSLKFKESKELEKRKMKSEIKKIELILKIIADEIKIPYQSFYNKEFFTKFSQSNLEFFERNLQPKMFRIRGFEEPINEFHKNIELYQNENLDFCPFDKEILIESIKTLNLNDEIIFTKTGQINLEKLLNIINFCLPIIYEIFNEINSKNLDLLKCEEHEIYELKMNLQKLENDIIKFEKLIKTHELSRIQMTPLNKNILGNSLRTKLFQTPPILLDLNNFPNKIITKRLALLDDINCNDEQNDSSFSFSNQTTLLEKSHKKDFLSSMKRSASSSRKSNKKQILDPLQMLRTVTKSKFNQKKLVDKSNLTKLATKWKEYDDIDEDTTVSVSETSLNNNPQKQMINSRISEQQKQHQTATTTKTTTTTTGITQQTRIITEKLLQTSATMSPDNIILCHKSLTTNSFVHHHQSFDMKTVRTSPSGHLDVLYKFHDNIIPPHVSLNGRSLFNNTSLMESPGLNKPSTSQNIEINNEFNNKEINLNENLENDLNSSNFCNNFNQKMNLTNNNDKNNSKELIFNVSDTILNDISF